LKVWKIAAICNNVKQCYWQSNNALEIFLYHFSFYGNGLNNLNKIKRDHNWPISSIRSLYIAWPNSYYYDKPTASFWPYWLIILLDDNSISLHILHWICSKYKYTLTLISNAPWIHLAISRRNIIQLLRNSPVV